MSMTRIFEIAGGAVSAQSRRLNTVASNLANADSVAGPDGKPYQARHVVFRTESGDRPEQVGGVRVAGVVADTAAGRRVHDPGHPLADKDGWVTHSNVNVVDEMVEMISASRGYQNNIEMLDTARLLLLKTLKLGQ